MKTKILIEKAQRVLKEEGAGMLLRKTKLYLKGRASGQKIYSDSELAANCFMDVLFINGCYLDHPARYRVSHQREQLEAGNFSTAEVFYKDLLLDYVGNFRIFIFFRCPYTDTIAEFIKKAKAYNKTILFDIDDLMIDTKYTDNIPYVKTMKQGDKKLYDEGIDAIQKLLKLCDAAITTTEGLAKELNQYISDVKINRNVASEEMVKLSEHAWKTVKEDRKKRDIIKIGYFSGSITHNADFEIVLPALVKILKTYHQVQLLLVGELSIPKELSMYKDQIEVRKMTDWRKLPELIASVDINIAPLENTVFNCAKSENKWLEASLVRTVTVASNVGAFAKIIENDRTGILCDNTTDEWYRKLNDLVLNEEKREYLAKEAYEYVKKHCTTISRAAEFSDYIYKKMTPNLTFILPVIQISGGALVALKHAEILQKYGYDVTFFNDGYEKVTEITQNNRCFPVVSTRDKQIKAFLDNCVATLWSTCDFFNQYGRIKKRYYLVQNFETEFYEPGNVFRIYANRTYALRMPVRYITISKWCEDWLKNSYFVETAYAPNGLETKRFYPQDRIVGKKIRILIEGNSDDYYKNVDESFKIIQELDPEKYEIWYMSYQGKPKDWYRVDKFFHKIPYDQVPDIYRQCDILIKSSILESFSYPPLEMMATGGCVVVAPNDGNVEYLRDGENCLFYRPGDINDGKEKIELLSQNEELRKKLIKGGIQTGKERDWNCVEKSVLSLYLE